MKLVFASDSFKGSLDSSRAAELLEAAAREVFGEVETVSIALAAGGIGAALFAFLGAELRPGIERIIPLAHGRITPEESIKRAEELYYSAAKTFFLTLRERKEGDRRMIYHWT